MSETEETQKPTTLRIFGRVENYPMKVNIPEIGDHYVWVQICGTQKGSEPYKPASVRRTVIMPGDGIPAQGHGFQDEPDVRLWFVSEDFKSAELIIQTVYFEHLAAPE